MKIKLLILITTLFTFALQAQQQRVQSIEQQIINRSGIFSVRAEAILEDGSRIGALENNKIEEVIGDSAKLQNYLLRLASQDANVFAESFVNVANKKTVTKAFADKDSLLVAFTGTSLSSVIQSTYEFAFIGNPTDTIQPEWQIKDGTTVTNVTFNKAQNGNLRVRINGTNYVVEIYGERWFRIKNYPTSTTNTDFYSPRPGVYWSEERLNKAGLVFRLKGSNAE